MAVSRVKLDGINPAAWANSRVEQYARAVPERDAPVVLVKRDDGRARRRVGAQERSERSVAPDGSGRLGLGVPGMKLRAMPKHRKAGERDDEDCDSSDDGRPHDTECATTRGRAEAADKATTRSAKPAGMPTARSAPPAEKRPV